MKLSCRSGGGCLGGEEEDGGGFSLGEVKEREKESEMKRIGIYRFWNL